MEYLEGILKDYPLVSGIILILIGFIMIIYRLQNSGFFKKEDDHDTITGEMNAYYWGFVLILIIIGIFLTLDNYK